jgi:hypothetical protein
MRIIFVDLNKSLVEKVKKLNIEATCADYFLESARTPYPVLVTASNPNFTFGGGIDYHFKKNFPFYCQYKQQKGGGNERIGNINFCITVDENYKSNREMVKKAIEYSLTNLLENETLVLSGLGTGIGGLSEDEFVSILEELSFG